MTDPLVVDSFDGLWDTTSSQSLKWPRKWFRCTHKGPGLWFDWPDKRIYTTKTSKWTGEEATVATCPKCRKRILCQLVGLMFRSTNADILIDNEIEKLGKPPRRGIGGNYGSGWFCELPSVVSTILDEQGEDAARAFIRRQFVKDGCQEAFDILYGSA